MCGVCVVGRVDDAKDVKSTVGASQSAGGGGEAAAAAVVNGECQCFKSKLRGSQGHRKGCVSYVPPASPVNEDEAVEAVDRLRAGLAVAIRMLNSDIALQAAAASLLNHAVTQALPALQPAVDDPADLPPNEPVRESDQKEIAHKATIAHLDQSKEVIRGRASAEWLEWFERGTPSITHTAHRSDRFYTQTSEQRSKWRNFVESFVNYDLTDPVENAVVFKAYERFQTAFERE